MERHDYGVKLHICSVLFSIILTTLIHGTIGETQVRISVIVNPIEEDRTAIIQCQTWDIPSGDIVVFEFERQGRTPQLLLWNGQFEDTVGDNFFTSQTLQKDGSTIHMLTITYVYRFDAGMYRCKVGQGSGNDQFRTTAYATTYLDVQHLPSDIYPTCHIVGNDKSLTRDPGSEVRLGCTSEYGSPRVSLQWIRTGDGNLPPAEENSNGAMYSEIKLTLNEADNGVAFTCTASSPADESYRSTCIIGPFVVGSDSGSTLPRTTQAPQIITTAAEAPPTQPPNTRVVVDAPGAPFQQSGTAVVTCQVWDLASNYIMAIARTSPDGGRDTLVFNALLLGQQDGRVQFDISEPQDDNSVIFTLKITDVSPTDAGSYSCSVYRPTSTNSYAIKASHAISFEVTEPPIYATVALTIPSPVQTGDRAYIQCVASGVLGNELTMSIESSTPAGLGMLAHDGQLSISAASFNNFYLSVQDNSAIDGTLSYFMTITNVNHLHVGTYSCVLRRSYGSREEIASDFKNLDVTAQTSPYYPSQTQAPDHTNPISLPVETRVQILGPGISVEEDDVAVLSCQIWGLDGTQSIHVQRTTARASNEDLVVDGQMPDQVRDYIFLSLQGQPDGSVIYYITMRYVEAAESGTYSCLVKKSLGATSSLTIASDSYYLNIVAPTPPPPTAPPVATVPLSGTRAVVSVSDNLSTEGSTVLFQCVVFERQFNHNVVLERSTARGSQTLLFEDDIPFSVPDNFFVSILPQPDGSLMYYMIIRDIHRSDAGTYSCTIYDTYFNDRVVTMSSLELDVAYLPPQGFPICRSNDTAVGKYRAGEEITLGCTSGFGKPRVGLHWSSDKETQKVMRGSLYTLKDTVVYSELTFKLTKDHNNATFTCLVTSSAYQDTGYSCSYGPLSVSSATQLTGHFILYILTCLISWYLLRT